MESRTSPSFANPDIQALYAGMALRMQETLRDALHDPVFLNHLAEEIADRLDGFEDKVFGATMDKATASPVVSEEEVMQVLKS